MAELLQIVDESPDWLVINKPAGLVCHPTKGNPYSSLISRVRLHLGASNPAHLINRLDRETSGIVIVAKRADAALQLRRIWENRAVRKEYRAIVHGWPEPDHACIDAPLGKDDLSPVAIKDRVRTDGVPAQTEFWVELRFERSEGKFSLIRVQPHTGRKHQIRIHLAWRGHPVVGDKLYGLDEQLYLALVEGRLTDADRKRLILPWQALHAQQVEFTWAGRGRSFEVEPERWFTEFCRVSALP